jgi:hypothetical protein
VGNSAVAVLHYDMSGEIKTVSERLWTAMRDMPGQTKPNDFHFGRVVSWDHASGYQVVVIHCNTGWRVGMDENPPPDDVLQACANALRAHGWSVKKPK